MAEVVTNGGAETLAQGELTGGLVTTVANERRVLDHVISIGQ